ncbi:MAG: uncharacterized protein A8A55_2736 [Amphiamblys sp. WSBS2006]|nr:MAG: uncharacterized protein A8A55_2736 [Amphiamblys sp. WSBS2006]
MDPAREDSAQEKRAATPEQKRKKKRQKTGSTAKVCGWADCMVVFDSTEKLSEHVMEEHIDTQKKNYVCHWVNCDREKKKHPSRYSLISHTRSHTGEKPFSCTYKDCRKPFSRSDACAKHIKMHEAEPLHEREEVERARRDLEDQKRRFDFARPREHPADSQTCELRRQLRALSVENRALKEELRQIADTATEQRARKEILLEKIKKTPYGLSLLRKTTQKKQAAG